MRITDDYYKTPFDHRLILPESNRKPSIPMFRLLIDRIEKLHPSFTN